MHTDIVIGTGPTCDDWAGGLWRVENSAGPMASWPENTGMGMEKVGRRLYRAPANWNGFPVSRRIVTVR